MKFYQFILFMGLIFTNVTMGFVLRRTIVRPVTHQRSSIQLFPGMTYRDLSDQLAGVEIELGRLQSMNTLDCGSIYFDGLPLDEVVSVDHFECLGRSRLIRVFEMDDMEID